MEMKITIPLEVLKKLGENEKQLTMVQDKYERTWYIDGDIVLTETFYYKEDKDA